MRYRRDIQGLLIVALVVILLSMMGALWIRKPENPCAGAEEALWQCKRENRMHVERCAREVYGVHACYAFRQVDDMHR